MNKARALHQLILLTAICMAGLHVRAADLPGDAQNYLAQLLAQAEAAKLDAQPLWRNLVHYKKAEDGGWISEVDGEGFFADAVRGKTDPRAELIATLKAFFSQEPIAPTKLSGQCRFVARFDWLSRQLNFDAALMPRENCKEFDTIYDAVQPNALTLVFPATHPNSPSSMFGHTLLRVDKKNQTKETAMLAYSINFAAMIAPDENSLFYVLLGLTGGYKGMFSILPYYVKLREYSHLEDRDIWEYKLNLAPEQLRFVLMHAYELTYTYFDYYFFTENCSYHLLSLLDPLYPEQPLTDEFRAWVTPVDTVRLLDKRGLIADVIFRPALNTSIRQKYARLSADERRAALAMATSREADIDQTTTAEMPANGKASVLDMAFDMTRYARIGNSDYLDAKLTTKERSLLKVRSQIPIRSASEEIIPTTLRPDYGHRSSRVTFGGGWESAQTFESMNWRATYHDLLDPPQGFIPGYGIDFFEVEARRWNDEQGLHLDRLKLLDVTLLSPRDAFFKKWSWRAQVSWQRREFDSLRDAHMFSIDGGYGAAYPLTAGFNSTGFIFLSGLGDIETAPLGYRLAPGIQLGIDAGTTRTWRMQLRADAYAGLLGSDFRLWTIYTAQSLTLTTNTSLRLLAGYTAINGQGGGSGKISFQWYY